MLKRYIFFIAASFLVFWLYAIFFPPRPPVKPPPTESVEGKEAPTPPVKEEEKKEAPPPAKPLESERIVQAAPAEKPTVTQEQREAEEEVWLENDYCRMRLTKFGAAVREILLYTTRDNKKVVIHGEDPVRLPHSAVNNEELNPLAITSLNGKGLDLSTNSFDLKERTAGTAVYELNLGTGLKVTKSFELARDNYFLTLQVVFQNLSEKPLHVGEHRINVGTVFSTGARAGYRDINFIVLGAGKARKLSSNPKKAHSERFDFLRWASAGNKYFALILAPEERRSKGRFEVVPQVAETSQPAGSSEKAAARNQRNYYYFLGLGMEGFDLKPGAREVRRYCFYAGPKEYDRLKKLNPGAKFSEDLQFEKVMRFGWFGFVGVPLLKVLKVCYKVVPNYGVAIIFLTILIKLVLYPLDQKSYKSMKEMQKIQPLIAEMKKKYKDDPKRAQTEQMKLFKEHKVNPLGGCLPMLLQMPVLIAMFQMLRSAVELRRAPFAFWIKDLSEPDAVVDFGISLPILGHFTLNILPLILILTFILQTRISKMASAKTQQDPQQKAMGHMMTLVFGVIFYNMPSGLTLYFSVSTILRSVQQYFVQKKS